MVDFLKRIFGKKNQDSKLSELENRDRSEDIEYAESYARQVVRGGYWPRSEAILLLKEWIEDDGLGIDSEPLIEREIANLLLEQTSWPDVTDYDRLNKVMLDLEALGVVSRENFSCCGSCGAVEIWDEINRFNESGKVAIGYVFFHEQGTESAVEGHDLYLSYGTADENLKGVDYDQASVEIGKIIASHFEKSGLSTIWDGTIGKRIGVQMDWKRRWVASV